MEFGKKIIGSPWKFIQDVFFPPVCINCQNPIADQKLFLCQSCFEEINLNSSLYCPECMARIPGNIRCHNAGYVLAPASRFEAPIPALIYAFKYGKIERLNVLLSALVISYLIRTKIEVSEYVITFVPLHGSKQRARGFNQAQLLASTVSGYFSCTPVNILRRIKNNPPQAKIKSYTQRAANISECFRITLPQTIAGKNVIVIDDVSTSGATLNEISSLLKKYGAKKIIGLVVAKA